MPGSPGDQEPRGPSAWIIPAEIEAVFRNFRTRAFTTLARDGTPIAWPTLPFWQPNHGRFLIITSIGLPQKAFNVRRDPRVALFFSEPRASGLANPPAVLVQGDATSPETVHVDVSNFIDEPRLTLQRQPAGRFYSSNPITRWLFD